MTDTVRVQMDAEGRFIDPDTAHSSHIEKPDNVPGIRYRDADAVNAAYRRASEAMRSSGAQRLRQQETERLVKDAERMMVKSQELKAQGDPQAQAYIDGARRAMEHAEKGLPQLWAKKDSAETPQAEGRAQLLREFEQQEADGVFDHRDWFR